MELWDVIVVGAGPAGSSAARVAAENGARVLLLDKAHFPRYKTCGGGLIGISIDYLPASVLRTIEQRVTRVRFTLRGRSANTHRARESFLGLVQRDVFDQALVDAAVVAGVDFRDGVSVRGIKDDGTVTLSTSAGEFEATTVIGADGAGGRVGRYVGVTPGGVDLALEREIIRPTDGRTWDDRVFLDWGSDAGTYAWMFPKTESLTVGVIQKRGVPDETRAYLERYTRELGLADAVVTRSSGHLAQWRTPDSPLRKGNVIVVGDAAALLDPFTREGISFALRSGTWAGDAAASKNLEAYVIRVDRDLAPDIAASAILLSLFERRPGLVHAGLSYTIVGARIFIRVCSGRVTMAELYRTPVARLLRRALGRSR